MELISHFEVDASQPSTISFSTIPQTYTDLYLVMSLRNTQNYNYQTMSFNSSTSNFTQSQLDGDGSTPAAAPRTDSIMRFSANTNSFTVNTFASAQIYIPDYTSDRVKPFSVEAVTENNATQAFMALLAGLWNQTAPITSIVLTSPANFAQYGSATLYGITAGSDGTTVVS